MKKNFNPENWIEILPIFIIEILNIHRKKHMFKCSLEISSFCHQLTADRILLLDYNFHCYVILYYHNGQHNYIADGTNRFIEDEKVMTNIKALVGFNLKGVRYDNQLRIDHCGGAAACITLAFLNSYGNGRVEEKLYLNKDTTAIVRQRLCKGQSEAINEQRTNKPLRWNSTCACGRFFMKRNQLQLHVRNRRGKN